MRFSRVKIRLSEDKIKKIKESVFKYFKGESIEIYIFGSRIDLTRKGGDIDILIKVGRPISGEEKFKAKIKILSNLYKAFGERKIDLLIIDKPKKIIEKIALKKGIKI